MSEFVEIKASDLRDKALDYMTAKAAGIQMFETGDKWPGNGAVTEATRVNPAVIVDQMFNLHFEASMRSVRWSPSTDWSQGGPLLDKYCQGFSVLQDHNGSLWRAFAYSRESGVKRISVGESILIAACRAIVALVLGDTVSVPKELV